MAVLYGQEQVVTDEQCMAESELAAHIEGDGNLVDVNPHIRVDYTGTASHPIKLGGALVLECTVVSEEGVRFARFDIDDKNRPISEEAITYFGAIAETKKRQGDSISRYVSQAA